MSKDNAASSLMAELCGELSQLAANYWQGRNRLFMECGGLRAELQSYVCLFLCLFSWRYNPLWLYFSQPDSGL
jgi:hypothetical protein